MTYTAPTDLVYSGSNKTATVTAATGVTGLGEITVKYYSDAARTTEVTETRNVGTYYVGATVTEGDQYAASTAVVYGDDWTFAITPSTPSAPAAPTKASGGKTTIGQLRVQQGWRELAEQHRVHRPAARHRIHVLSAHQGDGKHESLRRQSGCEVHYRGGHLRPDHHAGHQARADDHRLRRDRHLWRHG